MARWIAGGVAAVFVLPVLFLGAFTGGFGDALATSSTTPSAAIPAEAAALYGEAATKFQIPTSVLAAVGKVECDHGRNPACGSPNSAGAEGPMQFLPATFSAYSWASESVAPSPYDARDAIFAAAAKLAADGVNTDPWQAIFSYNHDDRYVATVISWSVVYGWIPDTALLGRAVLSHPHLAFQAGAASDIRSGVVDGRVLAVLLLIATTHRLDEVGPFATGHDYYVDGTDRVSNHALGRAVDIPKVDGTDVSVSNGFAKQVAESVIALASSLRPAEVGAPWHFEQLGSQSFTKGHGDHLHLGYGPA